MTITKPKCDGKGETSFAGFLFLFTTLFLLLSQLTDPTFAASSSPSSSSKSAPSPRRAFASGQSKPLQKSSPTLISLRRREWRTQPTLNSSRNARQVPEIPALYSAPQIQTPDLPALYSAPKINANSQQDDTRNEVDSGADQQMRGTTEVTIGDAEEEDETSSEDYQYGVPTEKYPMSDDADHEQEDNEYPTDSPMPQATYLPPVSRTNDGGFDDESGNADEETTEDTYSAAGGYGNNDRSEPSPQYGPPQANSRKNGNGAKKQKMQPSPTSTSSRGGYSNVNNNRRPSDQQQIENSLQPMTRHHQQGNSASNADPQPGYLPPVYQPPQSSSQPQNREPQRFAQQDQQNRQEEQQRQSQPQQETFSNGYDSNLVEGYDQQPPNSNYHTLPQRQQEDAPSQQQHPHQDLSEEGRSPQQLQGQFFGNNDHHQQQQQRQPNSFYGPPDGVNHFHRSEQPSNGNGEEELEGLNEKIVDAELLERVQQIIEDHERQQKALLDNIQKDNEKALFSSPGAPGVSSAFSGNELTSGNNRNANFSPYPYYGPPSSSPSSSNNGYSNPNFAQPAGAYLPPASPSSSLPAGYNPNQEQTQQQHPSQPGDSSPKKSSADVQVQKAVLSRHFTETELPSSFQYSANNNNNDASGYDNPNNQLNSVAGPGQEYLPPSPSAQREEARNSQNSGYSNSFQSGDGKKAEGRHNQPQDGYSVKVGAGIAVEEDGDPGSTSVGSTNPYRSNVYGPPSPALSSLPAKSQDSREFHARQDGGSSSLGVQERFPSQYQAPSQSHQQQNFQSSEFPSRTNPQHTSGPQTRYGPPSSTFLPNARALDASNNNNNGNSRTSSASEEGGESPFQIKYSNAADHNAVKNSNQGGGGEGGDHNQRSYNPQQQPSSSPQYLPPTSSNINGNNGVRMIVVPRPVYGVPLAPVITLDSDNNLYNLNNNNPSYSPDASKGEVGSELNGRGRNSNGRGPPSNYYSPAESSPNEGIGQFHPASLLNLQQQQHSSNANHYDDGATSYGSLPNSNNPSSSSSAYLMIQGHDGNSNNHIYNINHNGFDDTASGISSSGFTFARQHQLGSSRPIDEDDDGSHSIIIPGISNAFSLPIYDYSPSHQQLHQDELLGSATSPVVLPFEQLFPSQHQLPPNIQELTLPTSTFSENLPGLFYDGANRRQDNFRVSRRALSRKASISPASNSRNNNNNIPNQKQAHLSNPVTSATTAATTTISNNLRSNRQRSRNHKI